jgi:hypothetical protein
MKRETHFSSCGECDMDRLGSISFYPILHFLNQFWLAAMLVCSFFEAMAGLVSVATTAVSSAKVPVVDLVSLPGLQCRAGIIMALGLCLGVRLH